MNDMSTRSASFTIVLLVLFLIGCYFMFYDPVIAALVLRPLHAIEIAAVTIVMSVMAGFELIGDD